MASFYADENFPLQVVEALRRIGHDVLTAHEAGQANRAIVDAEVLEFATTRGRAVLTLNRWDFVGLHAQRPSTPASSPARPILTSTVRPRGSTPPSDKPTPSRDCCFASIYLRNLAGGTDDVANLIVAAAGDSDSR